MTKEEIEQAKELRAEGLTYREIGDIMCYSTSAVHYAIGKKERKPAMIYEEIAYKGFYEYFRDNPKMTVYHFAKLIFSHCNSQQYHLIIRALQGQNVRLTLRTYKLMIEITGKTFEELFEPRSIAEIL